MVHTASRPLPRPLHDDCGGGSWRLSRHRPWSSGLPSILPMYPPPTQGPRNWTLTPSSLRRPLCLRGSSWGSSGGRWPGWVAFCAGLSACHGSGSPAPSLGITPAAPGTSAAMTRPRSLAAWARREAASEPILCLGLVLGCPLYPLGQSHPQNSGCPARQPLNLIRLGITWPPGMGRNFPSQPLRVLQGHSSSWGRNTRTGQTSQPPTQNPPERADCGEPGARRPAQGWAAL